MSCSPHTIIRPARPEDAAAIVELYRQGQRPGIAELTALGCPGAAAYVAALIEESDRGGSQRFWVVEERGAAVVGFQQAKRQADDVCLNNLYVSPLAQGRGYGIGLYLAALNWTHCDVATIVCDVFQDNETSLSWQKRLGYTVEHERMWLTGAIPAGANADFWLDGLPQADVVQRAFGFSMFEVLTRHGRYAVGQLGTGWFRLPGMAALEDDGLLAALRRVDPTRRVLVIAPRAAREGRAAELDVFALSLRMRVDCDVIRSRLERGASREG